MNEPVIEIVTKCEHGQEAFHILPGAVAERVYGQAGYGLAEKDMCSGGRRVRLSRQEAIDLMAAAMEDDDGNLNMDWKRCAAVSLGALGASE